MYAKIRRIKPQDRYDKTERASNLTLSQVVIELAVRLAEKESLTLFLGLALLFQLRMQR